MSEELNVKNFVSGSNDAVFHKYRSGFLYYSVVNLPEDELYVFPIPLEDTGNGTFSLTMGTVTLMRWIRKAIDDKTIVRKP